MSWAGLQAEIGEGKEDFTEWEVIKSNWMFLAFYNVKEKLVELKWF